MTWGSNSSLVMEGAGPLCFQNPLRVGDGVGEVWERVDHGLGLEFTTLWGSDHCQTMPGVSHFLMT